eukprot:1278928-Heterocapsa_arctica.AAC.1
MFRKDKIDPVALGVGVLGHAHAYNQAFESHDVRPLASTGVELALGRAEDVDLPLSKILIIQNLEWSVGAVPHGRDEL